MIGAYLVKVEVHAVHHDSYITRQSRFAKPDRERKHHINYIASPIPYIKSMKQSISILPKKDL